jgi:hypothetical protein
MAQSISPEFKKALMDSLSRHMTKHPPVTFTDGTSYCDCGREVERRLFWWFHKDDGSKQCGDD